VYLDLVQVIGCNFGEFLGVLSFIFSGFGHSVLANLEFSPFFAALALDVETRETGREKWICAGQFLKS
jgi:hypothetical protein